MEDHEIKEMFEVQAELIKCTAEALAMVTDRLIEAEKKIEKLQAQSEKHQDTLGLYTPLR